MKGFRVQGGKKLRGEAGIRSAKNAVLPMMAASLMTASRTYLYDCPKLDDIENMRLILESVGCKTGIDDKGTLSVDAVSACFDMLPYELTGKLRSSVFMLGPMLARFGKAKAAYPGGCDIGQRPIDLHLKGFRDLGVEIAEKDGYIFLDGSRMKPAEILLDFPSVGATENLMMACTCLNGKSVIMNASCEPEVRDLAGFLNETGAKISGAGTGRIEIIGSKHNNGCAYRPIPDRIAAGTLLCAAAATGGEVSVKNIIKADMDPIIGKLREMGAEVSESDGCVQLSVTCKKLRNINIRTQPHPGFPTDMQPQMSAVMCTAGGTGVIVENVFENRFTHTGELRKMGADISLFGKTAVIRGGRIHAARVKCGNLRAGAALVIAALSAEGESVIEDIGHIDRGYERLEECLIRLGAVIKRTEEKEGGG